MKYIIFNETLETIKEGLFSKLLQKLLPSANPDFEKKYQNVVKWYLEIDDSGKPTREIGIDTKEKTIVIGPYQGNRGLWPDSLVILEPKDYDSLAKTDFETEWTKYIERQKL